jgi:hypothetical protein
LQAGEVQRFRKVVIKPGCQCSLPVLCLTVAGEGNNTCPIELPVLAQPARNLVTIDYRSSDIKQYNF